MRCISAMIGSLLLIANTGFTETLVSGREHADNSDVVLESAVTETKAIPQDTVNIAGDVVKFAEDESVNAAKGIASITEEDPMEAVKRAAALQTAAAWDSSNDIVLRSYKIAPQVGKDLAAAGKSSSDDPAVDVRGFFNGIKFPEGSSAYYRPDFRRLVVRQTMPNILAIEATLAEHHNVHRQLMGDQVEIETKFIEVNQQTLNELGFTWTFDNYGGGDYELIKNIFLPADTAILSDGLRTAGAALGGSASDTIRLFRDGTLDVDLFIRAIENEDDTDVLSAPRIVTRNGQTAIIQVGEEQMFPERFRVENMDTSPFVEHVDWNRKLMGVQLEVTPDIREEGLIDLRLLPKVIDVIGFDEFVVAPEYVVKALRLDEPEIPEVRGSLPYFRVREITTEVTVADGSTVSMGGLIYEKNEAFRDKVPVLGSIPFLGRLFRSEGERIVKRNLVIFVTATQVDANGRRSADIADMN